MTQKMHYVYVTTNLINGKQYVGDHTLNNKRDSYLGSGILIKHAIKKYGVNNFHKQILEYFDTKQEAFDAQEKYIKSFNTLVPNGYNVEPKGGLYVGRKNPEFGEFNKTRVYTEEHLKKCSQTLINLNISRKGKSLSEEHKKNISKGLQAATLSEACIKTRSEVMTAINKTKKGKPLSEKHKQNISLGLKRKKTL